MATLVLTAVGSALGGSLGAIGASVGGAIGALAGQSIDALIFKPGARTGPRLSDLQVQTSRYGAAIPRLYGAMRVAGTVIWATDLEESRSTSGGGKGRPSMTSYSYAASFAVLLSSRAITSVGRIWADGNLLRGAAGDFKSSVAAYRLHTGNEDQPLDPLIASAMGATATPAYRGAAYAVFEGLELADFGNRIPSLTFEVFADEASLGVGAIASDIAARAIGFAGDEPLLAGFAAEGDVGQALHALVALHDLQWREREGALALVSGVATSHVLEAARAVQAIDGKGEAASVKQRAPIETVAAQLSVRHHDAARDYQIGVQTARRPGPGVRSAEIDLPAMVSADEARRLADSKLRAALRQRTTIKRSAGWAALELAVGDVVTLSDEPGRWLVEACDWDDMAVRLTLRAFEGGTRALASSGESGAVVRQPDRVQGPTSLAIIELPGDGASAAVTPLVFAAATGADAGWRRAALFRYRPELETAEALGVTAARAVLGNTATALAEGVTWRMDLRSSVEVVLDHDGDALISLPDAMLIGGANLCQIGEELLQYGQADLVGPRRYRLSRLIRGRQGTEWACASHGLSERFVLIDAARLAPLTLASTDIGMNFTLRSIGSGDAVPVDAIRLIDGRAMLPPAPVHGAFMRTGAGDVTISWVRRSRLGWGWADMADAPLGEEAEGYALAVTTNGAVLRTWESAAPFASYPADALIADLAVADAQPLVIEIRQKGIWGLSPALRLALT